eukprot:7391567-Prymnesium_polylepis.11
MTVPSTESERVDRRARGRPEILAPPVVVEFVEAVHPEGVDLVVPVVVAVADDAAFRVAGAARLDVRFDGVLRVASGERRGATHGGIVARGAVKDKFVFDFEDDARGHWRQGRRRWRAGRETAAPFGNAPNFDALHAACEVLAAVGAAHAEVDIRGGGAA